MNYDVNSHYWKRYKKFIVSRKPNEGYVERHHIYPRSLFPQKANDADNIIALTAREHFLAHWMLHKAFGGGMTMAFMYMKANGPDQERYWNLNSYAYESLRIAHASAMSIVKTGKPMSEQAKQRMSLARIGKPLSEAQRKAIGQGNFGRIVSDETKAKISQAKIGVSRPPMTDEHRLKLSVPKQRVVCNCCGKEVSINMVNRWHNDNCKMKVEA
jgi:hypothetical protein